MAKIQLDTILLTQTNLKAEIYKAIIARILSLKKGR